METDEIKNSLLDNYIDFSNLSTLEKLIKNESLDELIPKINLLLSNSLNKPHETMWLLNETLNKRIELAGYVYNKIKKHEEIIKIHKDKNYVPNFTNNSELNNLLKEYYLTKDYNLFSKKIIERKIPLHGAQTHLNLISMDINNARRKKKKVDIEALNLEQIFTYKEEVKEIEIKENIQKDNSKLIKGIAAGIISTGLFILSYYNYNYQFRKDEVVYTEPVIKYASIDLKESSFTEDKKTEEVKIVNSIVAPEVEEDNLITPRLISNSIDTIVEEDNESEDLDLGEYVISSEKRYKEDISVLKSKRRISKLNQNLEYVKKRIPDKKIRFVELNDEKYNENTLNDLFNKDNSNYNQILKSLSYDEKELLYLLVPSTKSTRVISISGKRVHPTKKIVKTHRGVDFGGSYASKIEDIRAMFDNGTVKEIHYNRNTRVKGNKVYNSDSNFIIVEYLLPDGRTFEQVNRHISKVYVKEGEKVNAGDHVADTGFGGTGIHDHLEIRMKKRKSNSLFRLIPEKKINDNKNAAHYYYNPLQIYYLSALEQSNREYSKK